MGYQEVPASLPQRPSIAADTVVVRPAWRRAVRNAGATRQGRRLPSTKSCGNWSSGTASRPRRPCGRRSQPARGLLEWPRVFCAVRHSRCSASG